MGLKDVPAEVDYILEQTGFDQLTYVGHSEGTAQHAAGSSLMPEYYNKKMKAVVYLAPPLSVAHSTNSVL